MEKSMEISGQSEEERYEMKEISLLLESSNPLTEDIGKIYMSYAFLTIYNAEEILRSVFQKNAPYLMTYPGQCCNK